MKSKIAVIGGTGKAGKYLVRELGRKSFPMKLLHRHPDLQTNVDPMIEWVTGDARDPDAVRRVVDGCQVVISTIGQPKGEESIFSAATRNVLDAMASAGIKRYILLTGLSVDAPSDRKGPRTEAATAWMRENYPKTTADKQVELEYLMANNVEWTLVRLPLIELTDEKGRLAVSLEDCPGDKISATDLAHFLIEQISDRTFIQKAPLISTL